MTASDAPQTSNWGDYKRKPNMTQAVIEIMSKKTVP
jgi:hypothetical protein